MNPDFIKKKKERSASWSGVWFLSQKQTPQNPQEKLVNVVFPPWLCYSHHTACMEPGNQSADVGLYCLKECLHGTIDTCQLKGPHILRKSSLPLQGPLTWFHFLV